MTVGKVLGGSALLLLLAAKVCGAQTAYDLTGIWTDDVGGHYKIRQVGDVVCWYDDRSPVVTNVFSGRISGNTIDGQWWDLPGGQLLSTGRLWLRIDSNDLLVKTGSSPEYGGTIIRRVGSSASTPGGGACTPAGRWKWVDGAITVLHPDGTVTSTTGSTARWQHVGGNRYSLTWSNGSVDTLAVSADGRFMEGSNATGRFLKVECDNPGAGAPAPSARGCTPVGEWKWVDGARTVLHPDGAVTSTSGASARWQNVGGNQIRLTWSNGSVDLLTLAADGLSMLGSNADGRSLNVQCISPGGGAPGSPGGSGAGGPCADPRLQAVMDQWLALANPPDNTRPGWSVRYDSWGRLVGRTPSSTITGLPQGVDTPLTRCEYLRSIAGSLGSTNLGTLRQYLERNSLSAP